MWTASPSRRHCVISRSISHYKILDKLGEGGMGVVYKAHDARLQRTVALKLLASHLLKDPQAKERFLREARAAAALDHPNVCTVYEADEAEDRAFIAMGFVDGLSLRQMIDAGPLDLGRVLDLARQAAQGLGAAHRKGIIHRDIKSANIMVTRDGLVKVMDFGLAKLASQTALTQAGLSVGTPAYMSPEQVVGQEVDPRSDIWSLGVVLYEMLTGRMPFQSEYQQALYYAILNEEPLAVSRLRPGVPAALDTLISQALTKNRAQRIPHAEQLAAALQSLLRLTALAGAAAPTPSGAEPWAPAATTGMADSAAPAPAWSGISTGEAARALSGPAQAALAVLPFQTLSDSKEDEYFSDGLSEELINVFSQLPSLRVVSRTSAFAFKGQQSDIREIGQKLGVTAVLEGSVRRAGNRLRITVQLVNVQDGYQLWAQKYDRQLGDIFSIQDDIARSIFEKLKVSLADTVRDRLIRYTGDVDALTHYWKGMGHWHLLNRDGFYQAIEEFKAAIAADPEYAAAHSGLANSYILLVTIGHLSPAEGMRHAKAAAEAAVTLNEQLAEGHCALGTLKAQFEWDWKGAEQEFLRAIELKPSYSDARMMYASTCLIQLGRIAEARAQLARAWELDPLSVAAPLNAAWALGADRQFDRAIGEFQEVSRSQPSYYLSHWGLGLCWLGKGDYDQAIEAFEKARVLSSDGVHVIGMLGASYALRGDTDQARSLLGQLEQQNTKHYVSPLNTAWIRLGLGEHEAALDDLEEAYTDRSTLLGFLNSFTIYDPIRSHPRFEDLRKKVGLASR